jgi:hypothetical protein
MQQEETLLDSIMAAIFPLEDNVEPVPMFGTSMFQARLVAHAHHGADAQL